jgi:hypothetical protein
LSSGGAQKHQRAERRLALKDFFAACGNLGRMAPAEKQAYRVIDGSFSRKASNVARQSYAFGSHEPEPATKAARTQNV